MWTRAWHHRLVSSPAIEQGRAALRDGDAATAQRAFELALAEDESGEALEGLGEVQYSRQGWAPPAVGAGPAPG